MCTVVLCSQREKKTLAVKRLDLDAAKSRTRKLTGDKLMQVKGNVMQYVAATETVTENGHFVAFLHWALSLYL